jgi:GH24 family phage-related lysozyme (muramidase)
VSIFTAADMVDLRSGCAEEFQSQSACFLESTTGKDATLRDVVNGYSATITTARFRRKPRIPSITEPTQQVQEVADWDVSVPWNSVIHTTMLCLEGVTSWKGTYASGTYAVGDGVILSSTFYKCIQAGTGHAPTETAYWTPAYRFSVVGTNLPSGNRGHAIIDLKQINS